MKARTLVLAAGLFGFWFALNPKLSVVNLALGALLCALVAPATEYLLADHLASIRLTPGQLLRLALYFPFLVWEIVKANVDVAERVLDPGLPISPVIIKFRFLLKDDLPTVTLANSITLTPGTLTVDVRDDEFTIHCLAEEFAEGIFAETLQKQVIWVYREDAAPADDVARAEGIS